MRRVWTVLLLGFAAACMVDFGAAPLEVEPSGDATEGPAVDGEIEFVVEMLNLAFVPRSITVPVGATVTWINRDPMDHTVSEGDPPGSASIFDSGLLGPQQRWSYTFTEPGSWEYFCRTHPSLMRDSEVIVQ